MRATGNSTSQRVSGEKSGQMALFMKVSIEKGNETASFVYYTTTEISILAKWKMTVGKDKVY